MHQTTAFFFLAAFWINAFEKMAGWSRCCSSLLYRGNVEGSASKTGQDKSKGSFAVFLAETSYSFHIFSTAAAVGWSFFLSFSFAFLLN
jgi:hypothetical protein